MIEDAFGEDHEEEETSIRWSNTSSNNYSVNLGNFNSTSAAGWTCSGCGQWVSSYLYHSCPGSTYRWYDYGTTYYIHSSNKCCPYCKAINHDTPEACSRVKSIKYHENGNIKSIKFRDDS